MPRARARGRANLYCDDDALARAAACLCIAETDRVVRTRTEDFPQVQRRSGDPRRANVELQARRRPRIRATLVGERWAVRAGVFAGGGGLKPLAPISGTSRTRA